MTPVVVLTLLASALLVACGDRAEALPSPPPAPEKVVQLDEVKPAEVVVLSLAELGFTAAVDKVTSSGAVSDAIVKDGTLRFSTPGDKGVNQEATFEIQGTSTRQKFRVLIRSLRPTRPLPHVEPPEEGSPAPVPPPPPLTISGLGPGNAISAAPLTFKLQGISGLDLKDDSDALVIGANNVAVSLNKFWVFNPTDSSFSISSPTMQQLLSALPTGPLNMVLNFVSKDGEFAVSYDMLVTGPGAKLSGKLQSPQGDPITSLAGRKILLKGFNSQMRAVAVADANGGFTFDGAIPDTYQLTLSDLQNPNIVSASTEIFASTTQANVTLVVPSGIDVSTSAKLAAVQKGAAITSSYVAGTVKQNGRAPASRNVRPNRPTD